MFKRYCKLIFITLVIALAFTAFSTSAFAQIPFMPDPISGAMAGSMSASGFSIAGSTGLSAIDGSSLFSSSSDPLDWDDLDDKYIRIGSHDQGTYQVELSPSISTAGERRTEYINQAYNLAPGSVYSFGNRYSYNGYTFIYKTSNANTFYGPSIGDPSSTSTPFTFYVDSNAYITFSDSTQGTKYHDYLSVFGNSSTHGYKVYAGYDQVVLAILTNYNPPRFRFYQTKSSAPAANLNTFGDLNPGQTSLTTYSPSLSRSSDSVIVDPLGRKNYINIPKSYLSDITFTEDTDITDDNTLKEILTQVMQAFLDDAIEESGYIDAPVPPGPTPVPGDTVSDTLWDDFKEYFDESFGDIYDDIHDFKESFGDWVEDVASGWTEVFGDIYDDLHAFKESFGDWVDDVASGWTEIFGDIYSTLSGTISSTLSTIASAVQSLVSTIENADFDFIDAFWKNFLTPFSNLFNTIKSHLSIWHYVVEWLASISSVFTFYRGVFSGAGSGFLLPIYACFAGTVVIAVYKRFGK